LFHDWQTFTFANKKFLQNFYFISGIIWLATTFVTRVDLMTRSEFSRNSSTATTSSSCPPPGDTFKYLFSVLKKIDRFRILKMLNFYTSLNGIFHCNFEISKKSVFKDNFLEIRWRTMKSEMAKFLSLANMKLFFTWNLKCTLKKKIGFEDSKMKKTKKHSF
jgi:hypothetical protein